MKLLARWGILAIAVWIATALVPGIRVNGGVWKYLWVALLFGLINAVFGSILKVLTLPAVLLSFGLFIFVINAAMLMLTARWTSALDIKNFWSALLGSLVISLVSTILNRSLIKRRPRASRAIH
jgi:putative membrane protein